MGKQQRNTKLTSVVLIGCGNLSWHLAKQFSKHSHIALTVVNHQENAALPVFKKQFKASTVVGIDKVPATADFYLLCISDAAIKGVLQQLNIKNPKAILLHCSGSTGISVFEGHLQTCGVLYPLQSFSKDSEVNWATAPILIEASTPPALTSIKTLALCLGTNLHTVNSERRLHLHLAAVLVNNFTNALYAAADEHLIAAGFKKDFDLLKPIMQSSIDKVQRLAPIDAQTGPAKRKDKTTMNKHLALLKQEKQVKKVYKELSKLIRTQQHGRT